MIEITAKRLQYRQSLEADMFGRAKFGIAWALIFLAIATAPALLCLNYLARNTVTHNCCPQEKPNNTAVARCCVYSPAVTSASVDTAPPAIGPVERSIELTAFPARVELAVSPDLDTSPPGCSSILRI